MAKRKQRKSVGKGGGATTKPGGKTKPKPGATRGAQGEAVVSEPAASTPASIASQPEPISVPASLPNAATLLDELQQRCESLRQWQRQANDDVQSRLAGIAVRERELDESAKLIDHDRTHLDLDMDALKRAQVMFEKEKATVEQTQQALETERLHLERARGEVDDQKQELLDLHGEMDTEWSSLARVRRAHESLAAALDADRARVQELRLADSPSEAGVSRGDGDADDTPGLSLTRAA